MSAPRVDQARAEADALTAAGIPTYVNPAKAAANLPCVLMLPPVLRFDRAGGGASIDWRLAVLAQAPAGLEAWAALDDLLERLAAVASITTADPGVYTLTGEKDPLPAYLCTATD